MCEISGLWHPVASGAPTQHLASARCPLAPCGITLRYLTFGIRHPTSGALRHHPPALDIRHPTSNLCPGTRYPACGIALRHLASALRHLTLASWRICWCGGRKYPFSDFLWNRITFLWISRLDSRFQPSFSRRRSVFSQIDLEKLSFSGFLPEKDSSSAERQESIIFSARISKKGYFR